MRPPQFLRPGYARLVCGAIFLGLSAARLVGGYDSHPWWPWPELGCGAAAAALGFWGWSAMRRDGAARADRAWWRFVGGELAVALVVAFTVPLWMALPAAVRDGVLRRLMEWLELFSAARGWP